MEKFVLLILCSSLYSIRANVGRSKVRDDELFLPLGCTENLAPCSDVHDIATITCEADDCIIKCGVELVECDPNIVAGLLGEDENKIKTIDAGICKEMCRQEATLAVDPSDPVIIDACHFYRWEEKVEGSKCILQTNCGEPDMRCQPIDEPRCITGQIGCTEDGTTSCSLDSPVVYDPVKFHLICHGTEDTNIYSPDHIAEIRTGTQCYTIHMCDKWEDATEDALYYRKLAVFCDGDGTWKAMDPLGETPTGSAVQSNAMINENTLEEPTCESECESLTLDPENITQRGTELICDKPLAGDPTPNVLEDGTSCILICDNHLSMSISCQFEPDGTKKWKDEDRKEVTKERVKC